jgi:Leucine-rich repeat (LRR) protein
MEKIKEELKSMQSYPRLYLANYFSDLKQNVDLTFFGKEGDENSKYMKIINKIEQIEQDYYNRAVAFDTFDQEIESFVELDDLKYNIEMKLFQNKTILFIKDYGKEKKTFFLIIRNAYLRKSTFDNLHKLESFNREALIAYFICEQNFNNNIEELDATSLNSLKEINLSDNLITNIHPSTFNGLTNLEVIDFDENKIQELDPSTFNGLNSLKKISLNNNEITKIHPFTFNGLNNLEEIWLHNNKIQEIDPNTFNKLYSLKKISFSCNQISTVHPSTFNGLKNLEKIWLNDNKIEELDPNNLNFNYIIL